MIISLRELENNEDEFFQLYKWCQHKFVYEWFEQRKLSLKEIHNKYKNKLLLGKQDLFIIQCDNKDIGLVQIYKFERDINFPELDGFSNIYEYDIFFGEKKYLSKGIGTITVKYIDDIIFSRYNADAIVLRPFKRNIRAVNCYKKCNYKVIGEYLGKDTLGNDEMISVLFNEKK